jgi:hypothetical protein
MTRFPCDRTQHLDERLEVGKHGKGGKGDELDEIDELDELGKGGKDGKGGKGGEGSVMMPSGRDRIRVAVLI